jgi:hypothetical protein
MIDHVIQPRRVGDKSAQGIALGERAFRERIALKGRNKSRCQCCVAISGLATRGDDRSPGRCPGLICGRPFGAQGKQATGPICRMGAV